MGKPRASQAVTLAQARFYWRLYQLQGVDFALHELGKLMLIWASAGELTEDDFFWADGHSAADLFLD